MGEPIVVDPGELALQSTVVPNDGDNSKLFFSVWFWHDLYVLDWYQGRRFLGAHRSWPAWVDHWWSSDWKDRRRYWRHHQPEEVRNCSLYHLQEFSGLFFVLKCQTFPYSSFETLTFSGLTMPARRRRSFTAFTSPSVRRGQPSLRSSRGSHRLTPWSTGS